uniref:MFS transporter n=1 Tax=Pseudovibrio flavus TaxID=2529854 RepID=UPI0012BD3A0E|nr:MFS transporter [Pseudovibrio flavus]MTI17440.1 MFS transporter [Pseudovibrio flavus]
MSNKKWIIGFIVWLTYALFGASWIASTMMTMNILDTYNVEGYAAASWITNAITISKIIGNLMAAWFLVKLGPKWAFGIASALIVCGGAAAFANSYPMYFVFRLIMGFGGAFIIVYFNPIVVNYFTPAERPIINGINMTSFNTGNLVGLVFTGSLLSMMGTWQNVLLLVSAVSGIALVLWFLFADDFEVQGKTQSGTVETYGLSDGLKEPVNWYLPICFSGILFCYIAAASLFPLIPTFAVKANYLSAMLLGFGVIGSLAGIPVALKFPLRKPVIQVCGILATSFVALMVFTQNPVLASVSACLAGLFMFLPSAAIFSMPHEYPKVSPARVTVAFGMFWSISYAVVAVMMYVAGALADYTGDIANAAKLAVAASSSLFILSFILPETGKRKPNLDIAKVAEPAE